MKSMREGQSAMGSYGTARDIARHMRNGKLVKLLVAMLSEEKAVDERLTRISTQEVLVAIQRDEEQNEDKE